ncbi:cardiolipin synthase [Naasia aerilata]|uniref:Cardiolipin synthase n=1 Tax=Naasia aerilata TaxID=1162966 RepID=A0ABN6XKZ0_9MICO|nr:cardiolipin synthase [Naasia aerilata]BDZ45610.1 cardiolipin synthase [Naasia aerilata]
MDVASATLAIAILLIILDLSIRVGAVILIPRNRKPTSATAWLLLVLFLPYVGLLLYLLIGSPRLPKRRRERQKDIDEIIRDTTEGMDRVNRTASWPTWLESVVELNRTLGSMPLVGGNSARLLPNYDESIRAMADEVNRAQRYVHAQFYILSADPATEPFFAALEAAVKRGVSVRVLLDHVASLQYPGYRKTIKRLTRAGIDWRLLLPVQPLKGRWQRPDLRNHRKLLVVDGTVAYMGSQNMIDRSYNRWINRKRHLQWKDLMARLRGPIVAGINAIFLTDWYGETGELLTSEVEPMEDQVADHMLDCQVVPSGPGFEGENNLRLFNALLYYAQEQLIIASPYFVPDESMLYAITTAVQRGIRVELFVSEIGDQFLVSRAQRSYYRELLEAGVVIWLYHRPVVLHAKHFTVDDEVAVIGSSNMDMRSFSLNMEVSLMVRGRDFVGQLRHVEADYRRSSRRLTLEEWDDQPFWGSVVDNLARLTSALQ